MGQEQYTLLTRAILYIDFGIKQNPELDNDCSNFSLFHHLEFKPIYPEYFNDIECRDTEYKIYKVDKESLNLQFN